MHIINRLPTPKLNNKAPWDLLFMSKPDISHLRTFGCICFPLLWPYNTHKPQPHTTSCIFLGYPTYTKGYICLDPITSRIYISRHVLFNETEFLASPSLSTGSSPSSFVSAPPNRSPLFDVSPSTPIPSQPASTSSSDMTTLVPVQPESPPSNPSPMPKLSQSLLNPSLGTSQSNPSQPLSSQSPFAPPPTDPSPPLSSLSPSAPPPHVSTVFSYFHQHSPHGYKVQGWHL